MLDAQVVKTDGTILWASEDPDLLWALRGTGCSFGGKLYHLLRLSCIIPFLKKLTFMSFVESGNKIQT
jgi:cysteine desulfurase